MTDDEIRIAIAGSMGALSHDFDETKQCRRCYSFEHEDKFNHCILAEFPDFPNDLKAMAEVEKSLQPFGIYPEHYAAKLMEIVPRRERTVSGERTSHMSHYFDLIHATARQRAEAYLRVKGLWKE